MKYWITGMTYSGNVDHLKELIEPIKDEFDGLCWVFNYNQKDESPSSVESDEGFRYLMELALEYTKKDKSGSKLIISPWVKRNDYSRNKTLFEGPMQDGDWFLIIDTLERIHPDFVRNLKKQIQQHPQIDGFCYKGKRLFYKMFEALHFTGNPHEGLRGANRVYDIPEVPNGWWQNLRPKVRNKFHWVGAYLDYYFFPNTNHLLLGFEGQVEFLQWRYGVRKSFLDKMRELEISLDKKGLEAYIKENKGLGELTKYFNQEKILNDWFRFNFCNDKSVEDKHDFSLIKEVCLNLMTI